MRKNRKVQLAAALLGFTAAAAGVFALNGRAVEAQAASATFEMRTGASVRAKENESGIRWETNVTQAWYNDNIPAEATGVSFGTFVTAASNVASVTELDENFNNEVQDIPCETTSDFFESGDTFKYYSAIKYTNAEIADRTTEAYATELIARSYVKYTLNEEEVYKFAEAEDTARCMRAVALVEYEEKDVNDALMENYLGTNENSALAVDGGDGVFETAVETASSDYAVAYYGAKKVGTLTAGKLTLNADFAYNENVVLSLFDAEGNYAKTTECKYITAFVYQEKDGETVTKDTFKDYINVSGTISGYYVLSSDIDLGDTYYGLGTFAGTLDGNGHKISGISVTAAKGGLFAVLAGTVKNVSITGEIGSYNTGLIALSCSQNATVLVENVYVEASMVHKSTGAIVRTVYGGASVTLKDVVVYRTDASTNTGGGVLGQVFNSAKVNMENCYYIAKTGRTPLNNAAATNYYTMTDNGDVTVFCGENGTKETEGNVTTYKKNDKATLTAYYGTNATAAKTAFDNAVGTTVQLTDMVKQLMGLSN